MSWTFSHAEEYGWDNDEFDTKEEAIVAGIKYFKECNYEYIYVGEIFNITLELHTDAEDVIGDIAYYLDDKYGDIDAGSIFLNSVNRKNEARLDELFNDAFNQWVNECNITYPFIDNIERIKL